MVVLDCLNTSFEGTLSDVSYTAGYGDAFQPSAIHESIFSNNSHAVGGYNTFKACAIFEGPISDYGYTIGYRDACQSFT